MYLIPQLPHEVSIFIPILQIRKPKLSGYTACLGSHDRLRVGGSHPPLYFKELLVPSIDSVAQNNFSAPL